MLEEITQLLQPFALHLQSIPPVAMWSVFTAFLSLFLNFTFREGNIFQGWLDFWADWWLRKNKPYEINYTEGKTDDEIKLLTNGEHETVREYKHDKVDWWWWKPIGGCVVCHNVWVSFCFIPFFSVSILEYLFYILISNFIVRFFHERLL